MRGKKKVFCKQSVVKFELLKQFMENRSYLTSAIS